jgi:hypothetical protein
LSQQRIQLPQHSHNTWHGSHGAWWRWSA